MRMVTAEMAAALIARTEARRVAASSALDPARRVRLGQYFTPVPVARLVASLPRLPAGNELRVLDAGAGIGSLAAALVARLLGERPQLSVHLTACEADASLLPELEATLADCRQTAGQAGVRVETTVVAGDFISWAGEHTAGTLLDGAQQRFGIAVLNPPYRKISAGAPEQRVLARIGAHVTNLYVAFLAATAALLTDGGQLAAITPRSFANGPYFHDFRRYFLGQTRLDRLHVYESRSAAFADAAVLQENVIFSATRAPRTAAHQVVVTTSSGPDAAPTTHRVKHDAVVRPDDPHRFIRITAKDADTRIAARVTALPATLTDLGIQVSTGRVVDFRARQHLHKDPTAGTVPLIYPGHLGDGRVRWPIPGSRKPNALAACQATAKLLLPGETYVLVKRFSSKDERRRVVAALFDPADVPCDRAGFENHLNVYHQHDRGVPAELARGLTLWLNCTLVDQYVRQFNGHTQINATDLRSLRYPAVEELRGLGRALGDSAWPDQDKIDALVNQHVPTSREMRTGYTPPDPVQRRTSPRPAAPVIDRRT